MLTTALGAPRPGRARWRSRPSVLSRRPELLPVTAGAVGWILVGAFGTTHPASASLFGHVAPVAIMALAAMGPFAIPVVRVVAFATPWWRTGRATVASFAGFLAAWVVMALGAHVAAEVLETVLDAPRILASVLVAMCAVAALRPSRARLLITCARPIPLRAANLEADVDCARAGVVAARNCGRTCAVVMVAMMVVPGSWWAMAALSATGLAERAVAPRGRLLIAAAYGATVVALLR